MVFVTYIGAPFFLKQHTVRYRQLFAKFGYSWIRIRIKKAAGPGSAQNDCGSTALTENYVKIIVTVSRKGRHLKPLLRSRRRRLKQITFLFDCPFRRWPTWPDHRRAGRCSGQIPAPLMGRERVPSFPTTSLQWICDVRGFFVRETVFLYSRGN